MIRTQRTGTGRLARSAGALAVYALSFLASSSCIQFAEHKPINPPAAGSGITAQIKIDFPSAKNNPLSKIVYSNAREIKYDKFYSEWEARLEATKKLARACRVSGFEDAALVTSLGHIYPIAEKNSAYNVYVNGKIVESSVSFDFDRVMEIARDERKITLYHCHPISEYAVPSIFDMISASLASVRLYAKYPDADITLGVVMEKDDGVVSAAEYTPKMDLFDIGMRARQSRLFERFKEAEDYVEKCKKENKGCTLERHLNAYESFRQYIAHHNVLINANLDALARVNKIVEMPNLPANQDLLKSYKSSGKTDDEAKKMLFFHVLNAVSYFDVKDVTGKK
jgi:hypothetical protein